MEFKNKLIFFGFLKIRDGNGFLDEEEDDILLFCKVC